MKLPAGHRAPSETLKNWWDADKGSVHAVAMEYVRAVDAIQAPMFDKFVKLEALYDTNPRTNVLAQRPSTEMMGLVTENVIASNIDTVSAVIAATDVRPEFQTDDADWSQQRLMKRLGYYVQALYSLLDVGAKCRKAFKSCALKGTGLIKVFADQFDQVRVDVVMVDDIIVDELECRSGNPRQIHYRTLLDREDMLSQFPDFEKEIDAAQTGTGGNWRLWAGYRPVKRNELVVIESWHLPIGVKDKPGYRPGRHCISIDGCDLLDEEYEKTHFPFAKIVWSPPERGWYGISLAERIAGIQAALNRRNLQIERTLDRSASPVTYVSLADAKITTQTVNRIGTIATYKATVPTTVSPPLVSPEMYQSRSDLKASAYEESGVSRMAAQAVKPAGIDSGVAMREYRDQTTQRFAPQEKAYENLWLDIALLLVDVCKDLGAAAPSVSRKTKFGAKKIKWSDIDMGDARVAIAAASTLSQTPAGRQQAVVEWAQADIISQDEARRLMDHPDLESAMSIYTEAIDDLDYTIEAIENGAQLVPEPYQWLQGGVYRFQMAYLKDKNNGAPEEVLEAIRSWLALAANTLNPPAPPQTPGMPMQPGAPGPDPSMAAAPMPTGPAPQAAFSAQAMQVTPQ